jgi:RNA polymerase sigma factor (sigma-70 family)
VPKNNVADVFNTYRERLTAFIRKRVPSWETVEDILQEVFYQFTKTEEEDNPVEHVSAWLYRVTRNHIINWYAKKKDIPLSTLLPLDTEDGNDDDILAAISDVLFSSDSTPETEYLRSFVLSEIETALAELSPEQREIFEQTEFLDIPVKEIAHITGTPVNTLLSRKHYAVVRLRKRLHHLYGEIVGKSTSTTQP